MKVWERIADLNNGQIVMESILSKCPASIESKYKLIGEKRMIRHCNIGCGVECTKEYLQMEVSK